MQFEFLFAPGRPRQAEEAWLLIGARPVRLRMVRHRRARRYVLRLCPDGAARVTIPRGGSASEAKLFAHKNMGWLERQLLRQASQPIRPKTWPAGTEILFRGERMLLQIGGCVVLSGNDGCSVAALADQRGRNHPLGTRLWTANAADPEGEDSCKSADSRFGVFGDSAASGR